MDVVDLASSRGFVLHDDPHRPSSRFRGAGAAAGHPAFRVSGWGEDERAGQPLDALQRDRPLAAEFLAPALSARQHLGMAGFGLSQTPLGPDHFVFQFVVDAADLVVDPLEKPRSGDSSTCSATRSTSARRSVRTSSMNGVRACSLSQEVASGRDATAGKSSGAGVGLRSPSRSGPRREGAPSLVSSTANRRFVDHVSKTVDDASAVEVEA